MVTATLSIVSLLVSLTTAWFTLFRRGTVKMTQPTMIFFGPDGARFEHGPISKVYLRTLLFATAKRGRIVQSLHLALSRNETQQNFNIWVYGNEKLVRGSGLFVGETGVEANHHFMAPKDAESFRFSEGDYKIEVFAHLLGDRKRISLLTTTLNVSKENAAALKESNAGLYFDWGPDSSRYHPYIDRRLASPSPEDFLKVLHGLVAERDDGPAQ